MGNMPTFLVIGAARSGTTALYTYLKQHPMVFMSSIKEPNFFAFEGERLECRGPGADYINNSMVDLAAYRELFAKASNETARGEASPLYLYSEKAPKQIRKHIPGARLVAILRNPVEQAFSHYLYARRNVLEPMDDFTAALFAEEERKQDHWQPLFQYSKFPKYFQQLERYYSLFPTEQLKIILYEDFDEKPLETMEEIFRFIGVDERFVPDMTYRPNAGGVPKNDFLQNVMMKPYLLTKIVGSVLPLGVRLRIKDMVSSRNLERPELPQAARDHLISELRDDIENLQQLLGRDLSAWLV